MLVNTNKLLVSLQADRVKEITAEAIRISNMVSLSAHLLSHFLGSNPGYSSNPTILPLPTERLSTTQQSGLRGSSVPITTLPTKTPGGEKTLEWEALKGQIKSSYHQLRCLPNRLGAACVKNCTGSARNRGCTSTVWSF